MGGKPRLAVVCVLGAAAFASTASGGRPAVETGHGVAMLHFGDGRQTVAFRLHQPAGTIRLYRISAPSGSRVRGYAQLPGLTVPLRIATAPVGPSSGCARHGARVTCTVGEEGCPMPDADWSFRFEKLAGPAGDVVVRFRVA
jgi:hypothetical protein